MIETPRYLITNTIKERGFTLQVRHTMEIEGEENVHTFETLGENGYTPVERVYGDGDALSFLKSKDSGFGFSAEAAQRVVDFKAKPIRTDVDG